MRPPLGRPSAKGSSPRTEPRHAQSATNARIHFRADVKDQNEIEHIKDDVTRIADVTWIYRSKPGMKA